jgi:membrane carboxypeptidase/penicillin-binding protein
MATNLVGAGRTGGSVAIPIFEPVMQAVWTHYAPKTELRPPSPEASRYLAVTREERKSSKSRKTAMLPEYLRRDERGRTVDARYRLLSRKDRESYDTAQAPKRKARQEKTAQETARQPEQTRSASDARREGSWFGGNGFFGWQRWPSEGNAGPMRSGRGSW